MMTDWLLFLLGLGILSWGADLFVTGASRIALKLNIPALLIGVTVVAFGSSAPELFASLQALKIGQPQIVLTNIIGSNLCNIGLALGLYALLRPFKMSGHFFDKEFVFFVTSALIFWWLLHQDGLLDPHEGLFLTGMLGLFIILCLRTGRLARRAEALVNNELLDLDSAARKGHGTWSGGLLRLVAGFIGLHFGSDLLLSAAVHIGEYHALSPELIGLVLVAIGTSLPEIAISILAALRGEQNIALGNILGSNLFNICFIGGVTSLLQPLPANSEVLQWDVPIMVLFTIGFIAFLRLGRRLNRIEGLLLVMGYVAYVIFRLVFLQGSMP